MKNDLSSLIGTFNSQTTSKLKYLIQQGGSEVVKKALVSYIHEQGRTFLAKTALDNLAALSALEAHLTQVAPYGEERYQRIVDAYTIGAADKIMRW